MKKEGLRTFKSIERPAQVLGIEIQSLGLVFGVLIGGGMIVGILGMMISVPAWVYVLLLVVTATLFFGLKFLGKHRPPGYAMGYLSYTLQQPKRLTVGIRNVLQKQKNKASQPK